MKRPVNFGKITTHTPKLTISDKEFRGRFHISDTDSESDDYSDVFVWLDGVSTPSLPPLFLEIDWKRERIHITITDYGSGKTGKGLGFVQIDGNAVKTATSFVRWLTYELNPYLLSMCLN